MLFCIWRFSVLWNSLYHFTNVVTSGWLLLSMVTVGCIMSNLSLVVFLTLLFYWQAEANKSQGSFSGSCTVELHLFRRRHGYEYVCDGIDMFSLIHLYKWIKERRILFFILLHRESNFTHLNSKHSRKVTITLVQQLALLSC